MSLTAEPVVLPRSTSTAPPLVSVVIVCYNQAHFLGEAIKSVLVQTAQDLEIVVIDDGSQDHTAEVTRAFPRVRYVHQENSGLAAARNTGIRATTGRYLLFLDADDRLLPAAVEAGLVCFRDAPESGFVFGGHHRIHSDGSPAPTEPIPHVEHDHYWRLLQGNLIGMHGAVLYSREALVAAGGFNEALKACEDYDLYLRLAQHWPVRQHGNVVAEYRQHEANMSRDHLLMLRSALTVLRLQRRRAPDSRHRQALASGVQVWREYYFSLLLEEWKRRRNLGGIARLLRCDPRQVIQGAGEGLARRIAGLVRPRRVSFGDLQRLTPLSRGFGLDRGQPVDRYYIESFLARHASSIRGHVLEIGDDFYSRKYGGAHITRQDVLHVVPGYPGATLTADLAKAPHLPANTFDCIILTQTLQYIYELDAAVATLARILKPGGALLATLPGISQVCRDQPDLESDCWRFTASSAARLFRGAFPATGVQVTTFGNVLSATAFLYGLATCEVASHELDHHDSDYPVTVAVAVTKPRAE